jgi:hypothetical protein
MPLTLKGEGKSNTFFVKEEYSNKPTQALCGLAPALGEGDRHERYLGTNIQLDYRNEHYIICVWGAQLINIDWAERRLTSTLRT